MNQTPYPLAALRHHVTGAIQRGQAEAIVGVAQGDGLRAFVMPDSGPRAVIVDETGHRHAFPSIHAVIVPACYLNGGAA